MCSLSLARCPGVANAQGPGGTGGLQRSGSPRTHKNARHAEALGGAKGSWQLVNVLDRAGRCCECPRRVRCPGGRLSPGLKGGQLAGTFGRDEDPRTFPKSILGLLAPPLNLPARSLRSPTRPSREQAASFTPRTFGKGGRGGRVRQSGPEATLLPSSTRGVCTLSSSFCSATARGTQWADDLGGGGAQKSSGGKLWAQMKSGFGQGSGIRALCMPGGSGASALLVLGAQHWSPSM